MHLQKLLTSSLGHNGYDYYDLSFVDGFNLPISMTPIDPSYEDGADQYRCGKRNKTKIRWNYGISNFDV